MMRLNVDKWVARNGSIIEVSWDATGMSRPQLIMKVAGKETIIDVDLVGSKKFRLNGTSHRRDISLSAIDEKGKQRRIDRSVFTWGKSKDSNVYDSYTRISPLGEKLTSYGQSVKNMWERFPREKRRLYIILILLMTSLTFVSGHIELAKTCIIASMAYILYILIKR